ncbi:MAG: TM2 domain-containing protein [Spirochaetaceae bacterium]|nr:TM2 domain-containing protein [Spirochaetaceae bacterium]
MRCYYCKEEIADDALRCPHCGKPPTEETKKAAKAEAEQEEREAAAAKEREERELTAAKKREEREAAAALEKRKKERRINKHVFIWVGTFLFGWLGVDRFMRGQVFLGILKMITFGCLGIWALIDWIIALTKLGKYGSDFVFFNKKWSVEERK